MADFTVPTYITHYTPLTERKKLILNELQSAGFSAYTFIEIMDREAITDAQTHFYYDPDQSKWDKMFKKTRTLFIEGNQWNPDKKSWSENISDDGTFSLPFKMLSMGELFYVVNMPKRFA